MDRGDAFEFYGIEAGTDMGAFRNLDKMATFAIT